MMAAFMSFSGHALEVYLVRLLFCLFAEDTSIFERDQFADYLTNKTKEDGSDLAQHLSMLFYVLNTPGEKRLSNLGSTTNFPACVFSILPADAETSW